MAVVQINKNPSRRDLLVFVSVLPLFFGLLGALRWHAGSTGVAQALWGAGIVLGGVGLLVPPARRWLYIGWMYAVYPIAWTVSHLILGGIYFLVMTPIALVIRAFGSDPMNRAFDKSAGSYWVRRQPNSDVSRYFRQF